MLTYKDVRFGQIDKMIFQMNIAVQCLKVVSHGALNRSASFLENEQGEKKAPRNGNFISLQSSACNYVSHHLYMHFHHPVLTNLTIMCYSNFTSN
jgi:hypothetical protein